MSNLFEHCRTEISSASQRYEKPEAMQINLLFAEAKYSRCSQSAISLCQSAAGGGCVGRLWRLRAAALRVLTEERIFRNCILADLRSAGSHCKNSGSSDGSGASARSDRAKSEVFRDRSASAGGDTRYFSRCLIFWCFWIKPKAQKKNFERRKIFRSILREASRPSIGRFLRRADLPPFVTKRWRQKCPQGTFVGIGRRFSLSGHKRLRCFAHPLRALEPLSDLIPPPVQCGSVVRCAQP